MIEAGSFLDLAVDGKYYDATYEVGLTTELTYQHATYSYLTLKDSVSGNLATQANTPPSLSALQNCLKTIKARFDSLYSTSRDATLYRQDYEYASTLLQDIKDRVASGDTAGLHTQVQDFLNVYYQRVFKPYTNTNLEITAYSDTGALILRSPNGHRWQLSIDNTGILTQTDLDV